ncbi:MAG: 23S rRNA (uridine(2552)-2'-O)-methyltransferase RlmE [Polycyclovorans sp.]|nr:23S rRNA (uridine(2552)-2'-O)-methyltransferase RlmE [Polycyclovorans sp.]MBU0789045.1 23S rRNA (uridine(2552)-2'-O)-methyltransferase RlmE [Gammaproteobacteria bacterium]MDP1542239.1 23S rRNA (uridine(2552)-2'-O)-methyltransferase RlmE [Polycyclovorans sp.]MEC8848307.1 23S rRNA (uridine(2552)-2'-O)-methyltransferase RlmE [Pseudomonadota bacterium]
MSRKRSASSARWLAEHQNDPYVVEARKRGYRSRAIFKLEEIQQRDRILRQGMVVVDLGAAPGSWSQYARPLLGPSGHLFALDILEMDGLPDVDFICGDFREQAVLDALQAKVGARAVDVVLSDIAPNLSGIGTVDQTASIYLCELALMFALENLKPGGTFLVKVFQGEGFEGYLKQVREGFSQVTIRKPKSSRPRSKEVYLLARSRRPV